MNLILITGRILVVFVVAWAPFAISVNAKTVLLVRPAQIQTNETP